MIKIKEQRILRDMMEVNNFWEKYKSLATKKEISPYEDAMIEINQNLMHKKREHTIKQFSKNDRQNKPVVFIDPFMKLGVRS